MSEDNVRKVAVWLKSAGATFVVISGAFSGMAIDKGFGPSPEAQKGIYSLAAGTAGLGWILLATGLSWHPETQIVWRSVSVWALVGFIAATATTAFWYRMDHQRSPVVLALLHATGWLLLGGAVSVVRKGGIVEVDPTNLTLGMGAAVAMVLSNLLLGPIEFARCLTEGLAQPVAIAGWLMLVAAR